MGVDVAVFGDYQDLIKVRDVLLFQPDKAGVANDLASGYKLGINVVEVERIVSKTSVEVTYMFANAFDGPWRRWLQNSGEVIMNGSSLTRHTMQVVLSEMCSKPQSCWSIRLTSWQSLNGNVRRNQSRPPQKI